MTSTLAGKLAVNIPESMGRCFAEESKLIIALLLPRFLQPLLKQLHTEANHVSVRTSLLHTANNSHQNTTLCLLSHQVEPLCTGRDSPQPTPPSTPSPTHPLRQNGAFPCLPSASPTQQHEPWRGYAFH